jgi:hypothetical protein
MSDQEPTEKVGWKDIVAMTVAAYQVLFPMFLAIAGALIFVYLVFRFVFK